MFQDTVNANACETHGSSAPEVLRGLLVTKVGPKTPASRAEVFSGDQIVSVSAKQTLKD